MPDEKELINKLEETLTLCKTGFISVEKSGLADVCAEIARELGGYKVTNPFVFYYHSVEKPDDLIVVFYGYMDLELGDKISAYREINRDRAIIKSLMESRMEVNGLSKKETIKECAEIIKTIFEYQDEFGFTIPITMEMLRPGKFGWIVQKAVDIMNIGKEEATERRAEEHARKFLEEQENKREWLEFKFELEEKEDGKKENTKD